MCIRILVFTFVSSFHRFMTCLRQQGTDGDFGHISSLFCFLFLWSPKSLFFIPTLDHIFAGCAVILANKK